MRGLFVEFVDGTAATYDLPEGERVAPFGPTGVAAGPLILLGVRRVVVLESLADTLPKGSTG